MIGGASGWGGGPAPALKVGLKAWGGSLPKQAMAKSSVF
jgi:hypothetical protein